MTVLAEDLRLCTLKPADDQLERRFCFEIVLPTKYGLCFLHKIEQTRLNRLFTATVLGLSWHKLIQKNSGQLG